jgi:cytochrome c oxidase cbb3-type subunit 4
MNPVWGHVVGVIIVLLMLTFLGVWIWAWLPFHRKRFDELARIPMLDDARATQNEDEKS